ncbi:gluconate 2-dehydrogenase subunit 3 family protein [Mucilaginibacter ginsenosidivorans]|uniref:Gluconate 2-dehydrogenase subunit 3 family protein n=1 Tax=Mucilaginibacter ginsenosidivorans TaxID=398053 RepID=A0A5B8UXW9_9SPHI|nr:gluconate 2-dehydrogenase subunit 3 family protein [Mucilaginibacter ginsenosidivorans]QEC63940.1 gluconate 2-dehydrogenase subunit 3 family protein [Mucilaginibacter ginsenosidivorans]
MNRRDSLKALGIGTISAGAVLAGCHPKTGEESGSEAAAVDTTGRQPFEAERDKALSKQIFFDKHEMATTAILADLIIPKDAHSGSATDAKVPDFIEFIVKDEPEHALPMRGGLKWLDVYCLNTYNNAFKDCTHQQQLAVLDQIAYPSTAKPAMQQGVAFFNKMRDLTAIGFFTSKMGIDDLGYKGNAPGKWEGVPDDVLRQYGLEGV